MFTVALPPNTVLSVGSALIIRLFFESCSPFFLMRPELLGHFVRGRLRADNFREAGLGCTGFMNAAFGLRVDFFVFFAIPSPLKS